MNREIKFRGTSIQNGKWLYGNIQIPEAPYDEYFMWDNGWQMQVDANTVGQYTGLKDKNGMEIYEGDIVSILYWKGVVVYNNEYASFNVRCVRSNIDIKNLFVYGGKIIGNIHDNPELLQ